MSARSLASAKLDPVQTFVRAAPVVTLVSIVGLAAAIALLLAARRIAGAITFSLPWDIAVIVAAATMLAVTAIRSTWLRWFRLADTEEFSWGDKFVGWGTSAAIALAAVGCSSPGDYATDWLVWLPVILADQFLRQSFFGGRPATTQLADSKNALNPRTDLPGQIVQQLYRVRDAEGREVIHGTLRAEFVPGQRTAVLHVGFCPPLEYLPRIDAAAQSVEATVKVVQALAHGARLDVRLAEIPTEGSEIIIVDFTAMPEPPSE